MTKLADVAHARTGDKGDDSIIGVYCDTRSDWDAAQLLLLEDRVAQHFHVAGERVTVTELPNLLAFTVVIRGVLAGGVTRSLRSDPHGKTIGSYLLELSSS